MQITYDPLADALYLRLRDGEIDDTLQITPYILVDVDSKGQPLGFEILFAKRILGQLDLTNLRVNITPMAEAVAA